MKLIDISALEDILDGLEAHWVYYQKLKEESSDERMRFLLQGKVEAYAHAFAMIQAALVDNPLIDNPQDVYPIKGE